MAQAQSEIRYLTPMSVDVKKKKYCRFKRFGINFVDYKDPEFLKKFLNEQGKILPPAVSPAPRSNSSVVWLRPLSVPVTLPFCPTLPT